MSGTATGRSRTARGAGSVADVQPDPAPRRRGTPHSLRDARHRPLREFLREYVEREGISFRDLAKRTRALDEPDGRGMSATYISMLSRGISHPGIPAMELLGRAMSVNPARFTEMWAAAVEEQFNYRHRDPTELRDSLDDLIEAILDAPDAERRESRLARRLRELDRASSR